MSFDHAFCASGKGFFHDGAPMLGAKSIHLWLADYEEIVDEKLLARYRSILSEQERRQESRFHFARDRRRYLVTRALVRTVLSRYEPVTPSSWRFKSGRYGRPEIDSDGNAGKGLVFNLSHTHSLIILGVTRRDALGVDVENIQERKVSLDIADRFFSPLEVLDLHRIPIEQRQYRFWEYWTFKESYIKARGMGLSLPLDKFSFRFPHVGGVSIDFDPDLGDDGERWQFWQILPSEKYVIAVCARRSGFQDAALLIKKVTPFVDEQIVTPRLQRVSG